jgi:hypothetical protein
MRSLPGGRGRTSPTAQRLAANALRSPRPTPRTSSAGPRRRGHWGNGVRDATRAACPDRGRVKRQRTLTSSCSVFTWRRTVQSGPQKRLLRDRGYTASGAAKAPASSSSGAHCRDSAAPDMARGTGCRAAIAPVAGGPRGGVWMDDSMGRPVTRRRRPTGSPFGTTSWPKFATGPRSGAALDATHSWGHVNQKHQSMHGVSVKTSDRVPDQMRHQLVADPLQTLPAEVAAQLPWAP